MISQMLLVLLPGPDVSIGEGCVIGNGVRLSNCVVMKGVKVKDHSKVRSVLEHLLAAKPVASKFDMRAV
jgi:bifunctional N-acetylglucosamine-1-phosphate-uridyltransferase/glucosamine-1-phosphate-acetyltransferase GlmU-like protein